MNDDFVPDGDPAIDDVRRARHALTARFDHDPARLIAYLMSRQEANPNGLISYEDDDAGGLIPDGTSTASPAVVAVTHSA
jgi:hypothetical protein